MSDRMTSIHLPGHMGAGIADYGLQSAPTMIAKLREYAKHAKAQAEMILAASDADFRIETYLGPYARRDTKIIQVGKAMGAP